MEGSAQVLSESCVRRISDLILVLFGTSPHDFSRLARAVEAHARTCDEEIVVQLGNTEYRPCGVECFDFLPHGELLELIGRSGVVITQGGFGSIADCLERGKRVVAVPRKQCLGECHHGGLGQEELVRQLDEQGRVVGVFDTGDLSSAIEKARGLDTFHEPNTKIANLVLEFVRSTIA